MSFWYYRGHGYLLEKVQIISQEAPGGFFIKSSHRCKYVRDGPSQSDISCVNMSAAAWKSCL